MGFYGNITNTARTQFQFDKIYANRYEMVSGQATDGIYAGRYVLVEYDSEAHLDTFLQVTIDDNGYMRYGIDAATRLTYGNIAGREYVYIVKDDGEEFYKIVPNENALSTDYVKYYKIVDSNESNYTKNYNIDKEAYNAGRGYDSTVWQKMYIDNVEKYIMIAELNTVVPTFDVVADAPTMSPLIPHFDTQSTDVYYKLHWQSPWGFRVANGETAKNDIITTDDVSNYKSDEKTSYTKVLYDTNTDKTETETITYPAAIYYNKAGFDEAVRTYSDRDNKIQILPTGKSGNKYNKHDGTISTETKEDIMELSMMLPAIGNAVCSVWDKVYGTGRYRDINWKFVGDSADSKLGGMTRDVSTLAGCINSVHDLMGMIIIKEIPVDMEEAYENHYVYLIDDEFYRIVKESVSESKKEDGEFSAHKNTKNYVYYLQKIEGLGNDLNTILGCLLEIREVLGNKQDTDENLIYDRNTVYGSINAINEIIDLFDDVLTCGKFVIFNDNYKIKTADWTTAQDFSWKNFGNEETDLIENSQFINVSIDGEENKITFEHVFHKVDDTRTDSNVNDNGDTIELYTPIVDNMGHIVGKNIETVTLPYGFRTIKTSNTDDTVITAPASNTVNTQDADSTQDTLTFAASNRWIKVDNATEDTVKIGHKLSDFEDGAKANTYYGLYDNESISSLDSDNIFEVPRFKFDEAGHILAASTKTVNLPENFTQISTQTSQNTGNSIEGTIGTIEADTLTDTLTFIEGNQWVNLTPNTNDDSITISHYVKKFDETINTVDFNNGDTTFDIQNIGWDNAGHLVKSEKTTYTLPNNVKQITIQNNGSSTDSETTTASNGNLIAKTPIDTMTIDTGNRWIQLAADTDNKKVSIYHNIAGTQVRTSQTGNETPKFGKTFLIPEIRYDNLGHITSTATHTVTIPEPSLNDLTATTSSVITGLSLDTTEGKLTQTNANVGSLALTGYGNENTATAIAATDTINGAIRKLENQISNEVQNRTDSVSTLTDTVKDNYDNLNNAITTEVTNRNEAIATAVNALDVDEISADNSYISSIKQIDGKISANTMALPDYSSYWNRIDTLEETVEQLTNELATANDTIETLRNDFEQLKAQLGIIAEG